MTSAPVRSGSPVDAAARAASAEDASPASDAGRAETETPEMLQFLDPDGRLTVPEGYEKDAEALTPELLVRLYRDMVMTRRFDAEGTSLQRQGHLALWVPSNGQEGAQVGLAHAMGPKDFAFPTYREHGVAFVRGVDVSHLFDTFRGASHSGMDPYEHNFNHYTVVLAAQMLHAVGYAMGITWDAEREGRSEPGEAAVAFFGDGASSEGDAHEAMVFAASFNAPVLFFNQNNQYAISVPLAVQSRHPIAERAKGYGFPGKRVDGNDVIASYIVSKRGLEDARSGKGPSLIEAYTYRMSPHTTADDPTKYRLKDEEEEWRAKCPIHRLEKYLLSEGILDEERVEQISDEANDLARHVRSYVLNAEDPDIEASFDSVYGEEHPLVEEERAAHREYIAGFED
ncbi:thiamine pyrophosphate-dependent dehydrogenase E1 component subunit alpha [Arthrobacter sp. UM1]|uniref:thiamine pyrophosphate-dependent dehydrogenase E1 component subunit alpha n=1 Tax=Arthrobacter sp. UM1 TaxID=2766776 RepID=UPI001CF616E9|nr:thiamine pyrophosphate-dependent dehydrogenase E1 component subunit alpha [Arthrobacter sp. UM1]